MTFLPVRLERIRGLPVYEVVGKTDITEVIDAASHKLTRQKTTTRPPRTVSFNDHRWKRASIVM